MSKILISLMIAMIFFMGSCGVDSGNSGDIGNTGDADNPDDTGDADLNDTGNTTDDSDTDSGDTSYLWSCPDSNKFCHSHDGLNWSDVGYLFVDWDYAMFYCKDLGGRLPTISELRTLIQNCPETETDGECNVMDSCLSYGDCRNDPCGGCGYSESVKYSVFRDKEYLWSSSELSDDVFSAWGVYFYDGSVYSSSKLGYGSTFYVRCVK